MTPALVFAAWLLAPPPPTPSPKPSPDVRFPAKVEQVTVDVVVLDKRGEPATGLTKDDFTVLDEGRRQTIATFDVVRPPPPRAADAGALPQRRDVIATNVVPPRERARLFVVVFDDLHLSALNARRAKAAAAAFLEKGVQEGDRVLLVATGGGAWWSTRLEAGRQDILAVLKHLEGRRILDNAAERMTDHEAVQIAVYRDVRVAARVAERFERHGGRAMQAMAQARQDHPGGSDSGLIDMYVDSRASEAYLALRSRMEVTMGILERSFSAMEDSRDRKAVLLVSEGFAHDPSNRSLRRVTEGARRANAALYFIDTRGLQGLSEAYSAEFGPTFPERDLMSAIADVSREGDGAAALATETGGFAIRNTNDFSAGAVRIGRESRSYYVLGYTPAEVSSDGRFRRIEVRVRGRGLVVRARKGYYPFSGPAAPAVAAGTLAREPELQRALDAPTFVAAIPLRMSAYALEPSDLEHARVILAAETDVSSLDFAAGVDTATLDTLLVVSHRETGEFQRSDVKVDLQRRAGAAPGEPVWYSFLRPFSLKAGGHQAKLVVRDAASRRLGSVILEFEVPPLDRFRVSTPILTDTLQRDAEGALTPALKVRRVFPGAGQLFCRFDVYGAARGPDGRARVLAGHALRRKGGSLIGRTPEHAIEPTSIGALLRLIQIPLAGRAPGDYELVLTVRDEVSGEMLERVERFTVTSIAAAGR